MQIPAAQSPFGLPTPQSASQPAPGAVDPITGLPLHLLNGPPQTATRTNLPQQNFTSDPLAAPFSIPGGVPLPQPAGQSLSRSPFGVDPRATPPLPQQISQVPPGTVGYPPTVQRTPGPILFEGRIESAPRIADSDFDWGSLDAPIPQLDPPLPQFGNGDGELDLYDIIEEYTGRATHSGIPADPHMTHPDQRSWLRIEDWRTEVTWLAGTDDEIGIASARGSLGIGLAKIKGIVLRPTGAAYWLSGPVQTDLPSRVYDAELEATWMHRFNDRFRMHVSARGGIYSDFDTSDDIDKALRVSGTGIGAFEINPDLQLVAGVAYFNLGSVWAWPVAGVVYQPSDQLRFELLFPEGRISAIVNENEFFTERAYLSARFFGRTWQVSRANGMRERVTYQDWRISAGHEIRYMYGISTFLEIGYAFNREVEYRSGIGDFDPDGVAMISAGIFY